MFILPFSTRTSYCFCLFIIFVATRVAQASNLSYRTVKASSPQHSSNTGSAHRLKLKRSVFDFSKHFSKSQNGISLIQTTPRFGVTNPTTSSMTSSLLRSYINPFNHLGFGSPYSDPFQLFDADPNNALRTFLNAPPILGKFPWE